MIELKTLSERIDTLEARLMFQDETIETLNKTITEQWLQIDTLTAKLLPWANACVRPLTRRTLPTGRRRIIENSGRI